MSFHKWIIYTVAIGLLPLMLRLFVYLVFRSTSIDPVGTADIISYGLILSISSIAALQEAKKGTEIAITYCTGITLACITAFAIFFVISLLVELGADGCSAGDEKREAAILLSQMIDRPQLKFLCAIAAVVATVVNGTIWLYVIPSARMKEG